MSVPLSKYFYEEMYNDKYIDKYNDRYIGKYSWENEYIGELKGWGNLQVRDLVEALDAAETRIENLQRESDLVELKRRSLRDKERELREREERLNKIEDRVGMSGDERITEARKLESQIDQRDAQLQADIEEFEKLKAKASSEIQKLENRLRQEAEAAIEQLEAERSNIERDFHNKAQQLDADYNHRVAALNTEHQGRIHDLEFERQRLEQMRHQLADKEADLALRESKIADTEATNNATAHMNGEQNNRQLEL